MRKSHGLFINDLDRLIVDLEILIRYLHLVIFQYHECLFCHSQRRTAVAAQQHMLGKGHCNIDIHNPDSEYRDFFNFESGNEDDDEAPSVLGTIVSGVDDKVARLPSGKTISSRAAGQSLPSYQRYPLRSSDSPHASRRDASITPDTPNVGVEDPSAPMSSFQVASRSERRGTPLTTALAKLSLNDQRSLAHLSSSEQRAAIATQRKQADKEHRAELRRRNRVEMLGNRTLMEHFISETPARRLRYSWC